MFHGISSPDRLLDCVVVCGGGREGMVNLILSTLSSREFFQTELEVFAQIGDRRLPALALADGAGFGIVGDIAALDSGKQDGGHLLGLCPQSGLFHDRRG